MARVLLNESTIFEKLYEGKVYRSSVEIPMKIGGKDGQAMRVGS
jgi:hypothetical protein